MVGGSGEGGRGKKERRGGEGGGEGGKEGRGKRGGGGDGEVKGGGGRWEKGKGWVVGGKGNGRKSFVEWGKSFVECRGRARHSIHLFSSTIRISLPEFPQRLY